MLMQIIFNYLIYSLLGGAPRRDRSTLDAGCPETDIARPGSPPPTRKQQGPSFGTPRAERIASSTRSIEMAKLETVAFSCIALFAGLLTVATVAPIA